MKKKFCVNENCDGFGIEKTQGGHTHASKPTEWEKQWDKKFFKFHEIGAIENSDEMKPFIRELLSQAREEGFEAATNVAKGTVKQARADCIAEILKEINKMIKEQKNHPTENRGYEIAALSELAKRIMKQ